MFSKQQFPIPVAGPIDVNNLTAYYTITEEEALRL